MKKLFWIIIIFTLSGCATGLVSGAKLPETGNDSADVFIMRKSGFIGCGQATTIKYNGIDLLYINCGDCVTFKIPAGSTILSGMMVGGLLPIPNEKPNNFDAVRGENYYFLADSHGGATLIDFDPVSKETWNLISMKCNWVDLKNIAPK